MTHTIKISFCIPTRNRAAFIGEALESIIDQATDDIEIVVVDGASSDNTDEIIRSYQKVFKRIRYYRRDESVGVDRDVLKSVELAQGKYCWFMSDDDRVESGAIEYVLMQLNKYHDLAGISMNSIAYDKNMKYHIRTVPAASRGQLASDHLFNDRDTCFSLLGVHFGFLSCQIINKSLWSKVISNAELTPYCNSWLLVYIIGQMLRLNPKWLYIHARCVGYRSGNDSFIARVGTYNRQLITHVAFEKTVRDLFGKRSPVYDKVFYTILADRMARSLALIKSNGADIVLQYRLFILYSKQYWYFPLYWFKIVPVFFIPNIMLQLLRKTYFYIRARNSTAVETGKN